MTKYVRLTNGLFSSGILVPEEQVWEKINNQDDWFQSSYYYNQNHYDQFQKTGTIAGIKDVTTDKIWFDFDCKEDPEISKKDAIDVIRRLEKDGINPKDLEIYFSGNAGFHVILNVDKELSPKQVEAICEKYAGDKGITFDTSVYDASQILRVPYTKHKKSKLYKIPISFDELQKLQLDDIKRKAKTPSEISDFEVNVVSLPESFYNIEVKKEKTADVTYADVREALMHRPTHWKDHKWLLVQGFFEAGERNNALMVIAATYKGLGYDKESTYSLCKAALRQRKARTGIDYNKAELWNQVIETVFSDNWAGGQYSIENNLWLRKYAERMGLNYEDEKENSVLQIRDIANSFKEFVKHIDENTIKTGIKWLDETMPIVIGQNVGWVGAAGCHAKGTGILMFDGSVKNVEDVKVGDLVMGPDSTPREVLQLRRGREEMVKIIPYRSEPFVVNKSHILHLTPSQEKERRRFEGNVNITVDNYIKSVSKGKRTAISGYKLLRTGVEFSKKEIPIDPYILGLWLGNGRSDSLTLTTKDEQIANKWIEYGKSFNLKVTVSPNKNKSSNYSLTQGYVGGKENSLWKLFREQNLENNKHIPKLYLTSARETRLALLAGFIDSDGYLESNKCGFEIATKHDRLKDDLLFLARSLGYNASFTKKIKYCYYKSEKRPGEYNIIYISVNKLNELPLLLDYKQPTRLGRNNVLHQGFTYEILPEDNYYGFTLDKDHLYLTSDFFIHHNSGKTSIALEILKNTSQAGVVSVFASLDMHRNRLFEKLLYKASKQSREQIYSDFQSDKEDNYLNIIEKDYGNVWFYDRSCPTVSDIREYILEVQRKTGKKVKLLMVDYFERVNSDKSEDTAASKDIAGKLQDLVNDLDIALITLVQPNKFSLGGGPDSPIKSYTSIKGSSFLYQSFRSIVSLWRPFYTPEWSHLDNYMQMAILKNDLGEIGMETFGWVGKTGDIKPLTQTEKELFEKLLEEKNNAQKNEKNNDGWD